MSLGIRQGYKREVTALHSFDETQLSAGLSKLSNKGRMAFAAAVACRPLVACERFGGPLGIAQPDRPREIATQLWSAVQGDDSDRGTWVSALEEVMDLLPPSQDAEPALHDLVDHSLSCLVYAIRCLLTPDADEAAWAARCAYEAAGQAALCAVHLPAGDPDAELQVLSHTWVQRELDRQRRDLALLLADRSPAAIAGLAQRMDAEALLSADEADSLA